MANPSDKQMLRDANGDLIPQYWDIVAEEFRALTGENGAQDTRLTGSNVEEVLFINGVAITKTGTNTTPELDVSKYRIVEYYIKNTHDQDVEVWMQYNRVNIDYWDGTEFKSAGSSSEKITIPKSGGNAVLINDYNPQVYNKPTLMPVRFAYSFAIAPTEGSISIIGQGVKC